MKAERVEGGFGIYVHWPFCAAKCPYCDFNSHVRREVDQSRWTRALVTELDHYAGQVPGRQVDSVFFGGGTPSLMEPRTVAAIIDAVAGHWALAPDAEITLEANPTSVEAGRFAGYAAAGVNRLSMGVQALNDPDLRALGRMHSAAEARRAFDIARARFRRVSFDLIYARQGQTEAAWVSELEEALRMAVDHLSLYQLSIESGTAFDNLHAAGRLRGLPSDNLAADLYTVTQQVCAEAGMEAYEVSNHAAKGAESRHNLIYWRYGEYLGIGPGAHGRLSCDGRRYATEAMANPEAWLDQVGRLGHGRRSQAEIPAEEQAEEYLMMGLRLDEGVDLARRAALGGRSLPEGRLDALVADGMVIREGTRLRATEQGRMLLNAVLRELIA